ncbi:tetratricopeptide repeat protein [Shewanella ulleungensis]|uniref:tetratricopeptide repeat protein n=1 Tax=Shewanella ulleungensis TaxID=2282699 RepID=UPI001E45762F|nr:tetratricopeptide repeat protein [Shewanella ulleungensis]MCL1149332.1 sel1 repeat family protein [Shewanella ulleungensis]
MKKLSQIGTAACLLAFSVISFSPQAFYIPPTAESQAGSKLVHIQIKAKQGDADAQFLLGLMYLSGRFVSQNTQYGLDWVTQAAAQNHVKAQQTVADLAFEGKLFPRDLTLAEKWYLVMAKQGDKWANFRLGFIYSAGGDGVVRNCGKAMGQFNIAGDPVSLGNVAWILATCPEAEYRDGSRAVSMSLKLLEQNQNDPTVLDNLAAGYAEVGDFTSAIDAQKKAIEALKQNPELAHSDEFMLRLKQYQNNQAYREIIPLM